MTATCVACGEERHRGPCSDPIPLDEDDLSRPINQDDGEDDGEGFDTSEVDQDECGYCGSGTDPEIMCADCWQQMQDDESDVF